MLADNVGQCHAMETFNMSTKNQQVYHQGGCKLKRYTFPSETQTSTSMFLLDI